MGQHLKAFGGDYLPLLNLTITTALSATAGTVLPAAPGKVTQAKFLVVQANFTYGSGGTTADAYVQTSLDEGATWVDVMNFHFTTSSLRPVQNVYAGTTILAPVTPTDGSLTANTAVSGILGDRFRVKYVTTGTYAGGTTLVVTGFAKG